MSAKIFYFTGTGNSLSTARDIASKLDDAELVSIPTVINKTNIEADDPIVELFFRFISGECQKWWLILQKNWN